MAMGDINPEAIIYSLETKLFELRFRTMELPTLPYEVRNMRTPHILDEFHQLVLAARRLRFMFPVINENAICCVRLVRVIHQVEEWIDRLTSNSLFCP